MLGSTRLSRGRSSRYAGLRLALGLSVVLTFLVPAVGQASASPPSNPHGDVAPPAVPGQFIIKFKANTPGAIRQAVVQNQGGRVVEHIAGIGIDTVELPQLASQASDTATAVVIERLRQNPNVEFVEPNYIYTIDSTSNDPGLNNQWGWSAIRAAEAWNTTQGSAGTIIAVVDTGIQLDHPDLGAKIVAGYDYVQGDTLPQDGNGHGTHVAGTAAAQTNNAIGGAGMCPNCGLMPLRVLDDTGSGTMAAVAKGIIFAADNGAKVINLSLGGGSSTTLLNAVNYAWNKGAFLACAAGNSNTSSTSSAYPAAYSNCFAVASTTSSDIRSSFSNYGSWVEVAAPGSAIYSTWINGSYTTISGTSMATPHVAGLAGLLASQGLTNTEIRQRICDTADPILDTGTHWTCGRINAGRALAASANEPPTKPALTWNKPADIVYGTPLGANQLNAKASVPGSFRYTPAAGTVLSAGQAQTLTAVFTPTDTTKYDSITATVTLTVAKADQTISFGALPTTTYDTPPFTVSATASSGLPVAFAAGPGSSCTVAGTTVTITGIGTCTVRASQTGSENYNAAPSVERTFNIAAVTAPHSMLPNQHVVYVPTIQR